jgi:predicted lipoprotein with Yx(FWY)xxD motif
MNKSIVGVIIALLIVVGGGYAIFHNSSKPASPASTAGKSSTKSSAPAVNNAVLITKTDSAAGQYLADPSGKALYTYDKDTSGVSNCTGSCLTTWPAYVDKGSTTGLPAGVGTIKRSDNGQVQYTYNGMPLYYFVSDSAGQVTGDGVEDFSVAKPAAASSSQPATPAPSSGSSSQPSGSNSSNPNYY